MQSLTTITDYMRGLEDRYRWELVVVNDGSTDETGAIADAFAATRTEVRVLHHKVNFNLGQALQYAFGIVHGRLRRRDRLRPQLLRRPHRPHARRDRDRARPHRHRVAVHEGRPHDRRASRSEAS